MYRKKVAFEPPWWVMRMRHGFWEGKRMGPFREAVRNLLKGSTVGYAVKMFNSIYAIAIVDLASKGDEFMRDQTVKGNEKWNRALNDMWMTRNDMQNFIVLGDSAARAKMVT